MTQEKERKSEEEELEEEQMEVGLVGVSPSRHSAESHDLNADSVGELEPGHMSGMGEEMDDYDQKKISFEIASLQK